MVHGVSYRGKVVVLVDLGLPVVAIDERATRVPG